MKKDLITTSINLTKEQYKLLKAYSDDTQLSLSAIIRSAIDKFFKEENSKSADKSL